MDAVTAAPINRNVMVKITHRRLRTTFQRSSNVRASEGAFIAGPLKGIVPVCTLDSIAKDFLFAI
jgi:hypothetical protein